MRYLLVLLILFSTISCRNKSREQYINAYNTTKPKLSEIIREIEEINIVEYEHVGMVGGLSKNFINYLNLKDAANISQLVALANDTNDVVATYASWVLVDKQYNNLPSILTGFLKHDRLVRTFCGCIGGYDPISSEFYHHYWNRLDKSARADDKILFAMDSIILYNDNSYWLLTTRALENRQYPIAFNKQIEYLAFVKINKDAIDYISHLDKSEYKDKIRAALIKYLQRTSFDTEGADRYYDTVRDLLKINDERIRTLIIRKLKEDKHWKCDKKIFIELLEKYGISAQAVE